MEAGGPNRKKRKPAAGVETADEAPAPAETEAPDPGVGEEDDGLVDRISSLPDVVLGDIISLLPTDEGARTQILATKWRHLWLSAPLNLDCTHLLHRYRNHADRAAGVVSRILSSHSGPGRRLRVDNLHHFDLGAVDDWLRSGALDNLQELELGCYPTVALLPSFTFRFAPTLRVATLKMCNLPDGIIQGLHFPLLKQLGLHYVSISECSLHSLIASCRALECLLILHSTGFGCLRINSLTLRSIGVDNNNSDYRIPVHFKELIIENAPCLEKLLHLHVGAGLHLSVVSAPQLETIGYLSDGYYQKVNQDYLCKFEFGSTIIQGLRVDKLAMVRTVKTLAVQLRILSLDTVIQLMACFPCLEKLYIRTPKPSNVWRRKHRDLTRCPDIRLKTIVLDSYRGIKSEVNFVTFFVLNARVLELVKLGGCSGNKEFLAEQRRKLQLDKRASKGARIHFTTRSCVRYILDHVRDLDVIDPFLL
ncbi:F-box/FBD/LRR-repeat protein At1g51370-like [Triticum aestivum]|uniref:F-box/FBD/LRR-repeat protein At1g51370-like n=1 Tax=Triticum aestivum TaxID=4565 RepID=UPI001D021052|nr:F-box/FBD/LRR-repeat protein At1g51370-like [Triticum aestivum]